MLKDTLFKSRLSEWEIRFENCFANIMKVSVPREILAGWEVFFLFSTDNFHINSY